MIHSRCAEAPDPTTYLSLEEGDVYAGSLRRSIEQQSSGAVLLLFGQIYMRHLQDLEEELLYDLRHLLLRFLRR